MVQEAVPVPSVVPLQDCAPRVKVTLRPEIGVIPSSFSTAENVAGWPLAITVGLVVVKARAVSSLITVNGAEAELPAYEESATKFAVNV